MSVSISAHTILSWSVTINMVAPHGNCAKSADETHGAVTKMLQQLKDAGHIAGFRVDSAEVLP